jgi:hypothetical protein
MTKFLKFLEKSDRGGMLCPWGQKWTFLGVLTNGMRAHVSRVGTHRSNEWEGRYGECIVIHAARDNEAKVNKLDYENN